MNTKTTRGFTLIELLVVIAIIGILASVVLASLNNARDKGEDAAAKANLNNMRAQAELIYDNDGDYDDVCINETVSAAVTSAGGTCHDSISAWAAEAELSTAGTYYCVDSTGAAQVSSSTKGTATLCP